MMRTREFDLGKNVIGIPVPPRRKTTMSVSPDALGFPTCIRVSALYNLHEDVLESCQII
jgi:hypothetical protein